MTQDAGSIAQFGDKSSRPPVPHHIDMRNPTRHLHKFKVRPDIPDQIDLRSVYMPVGIMLQQVLERKNSELLLQ